MAQLEENIFIIHPMRTSIENHGRPVRALKHPINVALVFVVIIHLLGEVSRSPKHEVNQPSLSTVQHGVVRVIVLAGTRRCNAGGVGCRHQCVEKLVVQRITSQHNLR